MRTLVLILLAGALLTVAAPTAEASFCFFDPDEPVQSVRCQVNWTTSCVRGIVQHGACPL